MSDTPYTQRLSKSRYVAGCQCHGLLWSKVHEPDAPELQHDRATQDRLDQGRQVGELARTRFSGGVLIDLPYYEYEARIAATAEALAGGAPAIFEASFMADRTYVAVDVLERADGGFNLIEVKASNSQKDEHLPDAAVQTYVLRRSGIDVARVEIMHLNAEYRHPVGELFQRTDVTLQVEGLLSGVADEIERQLEVISGPRPDVPIGPCCFEPGECPFVDRCWPSVPRHVS